MSDIMDKLKKTFYGQTISSNKFGFIFLVLWIASYWLKKTPYRRVMAKS